MDKRKIQEKARDVAKFTYEVIDDIFGKRILIFAYILAAICCGDNLILKDPLPRYVKPSKPVGDGWLCNTCSDTPTKLEQIQKISESFNLGIVATLIE